MLKLPSNHRGLSFQCWSQVPSPAQKQSHVDLILILTGSHISLLPEFCKSPIPDLIPFPWSMLLVGIPSFHLHHSLPLIASSFTYVVNEVVCRTRPVWSAQEWFQKAEHSLAGSHWRSRGSCSRLPLQKKQHQMVQNFKAEVWPVKLMHQKECLKQ